MDIILTNALIGGAIAYAIYFAFSWWSDRQIEKSGPLSRPEQEPDEEQDQSGRS